MFGLAKRTRPLQNDYASCSGCGLCLLVCPVWRRDRDFGLTPLGRARALQHGAVAAGMSASIQSCTLCAACEPACPEEIGLVEMTLDLRRRLPQAAALQQHLPAPMVEQTARPAAAQAAATVLLPGPALRARSTTLARATALLGGSGGIALGEDDGADIALALEAGAPVPARRLGQFLQPLRGLRKIVVADGLLLRHLRQWLPGPIITGLGVALSGLPRVRGALRASDLYVIEPRAYHADYQRLVRHYDVLRKAAACAMNLDLQRIAIPAAARGLTQRLGLEPVDDSVQLRWILQGRNVTRIVAEDLQDGAAFAQVTSLPVVHLADLADDGIP
jgi:NAD-dependent dihydropyrimidine dehydrogenase PreA subunit